MLRLGFSASPLAGRPRAPVALQRSSTLPAWTRPTTSATHAASGSGPMPFDSLDDKILEAARDPAVSLLAQQVLEAEEELKGLFEPGRPMPAASLVAKKRKHISDMKVLLTAKLNGQETVVDPDASDDEAERARVLFLQVEKSLQRQQRPQHKQEAEYSFELSLLEAENDQLREQAEAMLRRQQVLEELAERHGLVEIRDGQLIWLSGKAKEAGAPGVATARPQQQQRQSPDGLDKVEMAVMGMR